MDLRTQDPVARDEFAAALVESGHDIKVPFPGVATRTFMQSLTPVADPPDLEEFMLDSGTFWISWSSHGDSATGGKATRRPSSISFTVKGIATLL